ATTAASHGRRRSWNARCSAHSPPGSATRKNADMADFDEYEEIKTAYKKARNGGSSHQGDDAGKGPWPEPDPELLKDEVAPPPAFPADVLPSGWKEWAAAAAEGAGCPVDYIAMALLCVAAALIGNARCGRPWEGWDEPLAIFVALIGRPSSGKSP